MPQAFQTAKIIEKRIEKTGVAVSYPQVMGLSGQGGQHNIINEQILAVVQSMILAQQSEATRLAQMEGTFTIELNEKGLLSVRFENYAVNHHAQAITLIKALTFNLETGTAYSFHELFKPDLPYQYQLNNLILAQIKQKSLPTTGPAPGVTARQDFYLMRTSIVIIFPELIFTPHVIGPPEFKLSFKQLRELISPLGPLQRLI